jgi:outer membrane protein assembly complex protein YaeT
MRHHGTPRAGALLLPLLLAAGLLVLLPAGSVAQRFSGDTVEVRSVAFQGARQVPVPLLRTAIETTPTTCISVALQPLCWAGLSKDRHFLDLRALAADVFRIRVFYYQRGFREARVELDTLRQGGGMHVRFRVHEGRPIVVRSLEVEGAVGIDEPLRRNLPLRVGQPFSVVDFETTRDTLNARLANRGFAGAYVLANYDIPDDGSYAVDVAFQLDPGPPTHFGPIDITGLSRVSRDVVERMLTFREGDLFSRQALLRSQRNLFGLEVFRHAEISTIRVSDADSVLPVRVQVNEGDLHRVRVGVGMSTSDYLNAEGRWISRNFLGNGRRLELRGRITNLAARPLSYVTPPFENCADIYCDVAGSLAADFAQPWFFGPANTLRSGLFLERFSLPGVYVRTSRGAYASLARAVPVNGVLTAQYRVERTQLQSEGDLIFCVNFIACEDREIDFLRRPHLLAPVNVSFVMDRSNSIFAPTRGYVLRLDSEYAGGITGSDFAYTRLVGEVASYRDPVRGVVIASRLRAGWARADEGDGLGLHPQKRFFAGGPNSVRGFAQYRLGPRLLTVNAARTLAQPADVAAQPGAGCPAQSINSGTCDISEFVRQHPGEVMVQPVGGSVSVEGNLEVRYPILADNLRGAAFMDFGQVWRDRGDVRFAELRFTPGLGIRYFSPVGPIRIDVGYNSGGAERLQVMTTEVCYLRVSPCGDIQPGVVYDPADLANRRKLRALPAVAYGGGGSFVDRLQFHFSIGQAF